jgi:hypothetical protein
MGTEAGISEFMIENVQELLPPWMREDTCELDGIGLNLGSGEELEHDGSGGMHASQSPQNDSQFKHNFVFKSCLFFPGPLHILHNASKFVTQSLQHYALFEVELKVRSVKHGAHCRTSRC